MQTGNVSGGTERFRQHRLNRRRPEHEPIDTVALFSRDELDYRSNPSDRALERFSQIASSMCDELCLAGNELEANFLMDLCLNLAEAGASDAEISHTAFEYLKNFPNVAASIEASAQKSSATLRRVGEVAYRTLGS